MPPPSHRQRLRCTRPPSVGTYQPHHWWRTSCIQPSTTDQKYAGSAYNQSINQPINPSIHQNIYVAPCVACDSEALNYHKRFTNLLSCWRSRHHLPGRHPACKSHVQTIFPQVHFSGRDLLTWRKSGKVGRLNENGKYQFPIVSLCLILKRTAAASRGFLATARLSCSTFLRSYVSPEWAAMCLKKLGASKYIGKDYFFQ